MYSPLMCDHCVRKIPHVVSLLAAYSRRIGNVAGQEKCPGSGRKKRIVMTQTHPKTPRADQFQGDREEFQVASGDTMKAIVQTHYGSPDIIQLKEVARPTPKEYEVIEKVHATTGKAAAW